ncbi:CPLN1 protein, partial [Toxostoma redivivum]|nr:CPLN1 protein [Toxostoma redivivum]
MNVSSTLFESNSKETGLVSPSQDLHSSVPAKPLHLLAPPSGIQKKIRLIPAEKKISCSNGFPLLKLESSYHVKPSFLHPTETSSIFAKPPSVPRVAWSSSDSLWSHQSSYIPKKSKPEDFHRSRHNPENPRQMHVEKEKWAETVYKGPPKHLNSDLCERRQEALPQPQFPANVNVFKAPAIQNLAGIPLLHLQLDPVPRVPPPAVRQPITTTLIPVKPATK